MSVGWYSHFARSIFASLSLNRMKRVGMRRLKEKNDVLRKNESGDGNKEKIRRI